MVGTAILFSLSALASALPDSNSIRDAVKGPPGTEHLFTVTVQSTDADGETFDLNPGEYMLLSSGYYRYAGGPTSGFKADVECSVALAGNSPTWVRNQYPNVRPTGDHLDMYVDDKPIEWSPMNSTTRQAPSAGIASTESPECDADNKDSSTHPYKATLTWRGGPLKLYLADDDHSNNVGSISVGVYRVLPRSNEELIAVIPVPAMASEGVYTPHLIVGHTYRLEVSGSY